MNIEFKWVGGATWILTVNGIKIACDPVLCPKGTMMKPRFLKSYRQNNPVYYKDDFKDIDIWLITHGHDDHLDKQGLAQIASGSSVITHKNAAGLLKKVNGISAQILTWGQKTTLEFGELTVTIEAIPAVHGEKRIGALLAGGVNGYWLSMNTREESFTAYVTADTVDHSKVLNAIDGRQLDLLIPNMGAAGGYSFMGVLTLNAKMLKSFLDILHPKLCLPVHFGTFGHYAEPISVLVQMAEKCVKILDLGEVYIFEDAAK